MTQKMTTKKLAMAGVLTALATVGSMISFPVAGSQCAPVQHMVNILAAVTLGPGWGVGVAFCASLLRNILGIGSLMAFPGSMIGAFCCGMVYAKWKKLAPTCVAEALGHRYPWRDRRVSGGGIPDGGRSGRTVCLCSSLPDFHGGRKYPGLCTDHSIVQRRGFEPVKNSVKREKQAAGRGHHFLPL